MSDIKTDLYKAYIEAIYDLNAEIFFNVAYEETSKGVYKLDENINASSFKKDIKTDEREEVIKKFRILFEDTINIMDDKDKIKETIGKDDFIKKIKYFNDVLYKKNKEKLIEDINMNNFK